MSLRLLAALTGIAGVGAVLVTRSLDSADTPTPTAPTAAAQKAVGQRQGQPALESPPPARVVHAAPPVPTPGPSEPPASDTKMLLDRALPAAPSAAPSRDALPAAPKPFEVIAAAQEKTPRPGPLAEENRRVDLNTASLEQLNSLKGGGLIGMAIVRGRPYASPDALVTKRVLSRASFERIKQQVEVR